VEKLDDDSLGASRSDYVAGAAKALLGAVPFAGSLLVEIADAVIPNQRVDRIAHFAMELQERIAGLEREHVRAHLTNENFTDLVEEGMRQAARSTIDDRRRHIANIIANSLTSEEISFVESKHLLRVLGEINDIEVVWLRYFLKPTLAGDIEFRAKHEKVLAPQYAESGASPTIIDQAALQQSYKQHLAQLGLLRERFKVNPRTNMLDVDSFGRLRTDGYELTPLGDLLLRQIGFTE